MSRKSQKRKLNDKKHRRAFEVYIRALREWELREPKWWKFYARWKWKQERPYKPKDAVEYMEIEAKYGRNRCWIWRW